MALEAIRFSGTSKKSDICFLRCTIVEMLTGKPNYADMYSFAAIYKIGGSLHRCVACLVEPRRQQRATTCVLVDKKRMSGFRVLLLDPISQIFKSQRISLTGLFMLRLLSKTIFLYSVV
ncbi:hypothetical protein BY458DRAFT_492236 [Sporodiniella umbellata]|nr:hypothetical protein BY458DRAFT_492236 [Sporodiniella umbellata]